MRGPASWTVDATIAKNFQVASQARLQIRADIFNLLNRVNYCGPEANILSPFFGQIRSAASPRTMQIGARLTF